MTLDLWYLEEIRDAVNSPETADPDLLGEASIAYADACRDANLRLREVDGLLRKGLRAEAIQVAEREPNLVDVIAELDFPLLEEWQGMLAQWGMQLPPQLQLEIASRLNAAYAEQMPLESLLRRHRMLALARAPLPARLNVLRQIQRQDSQNPTWPIDIEQYERERLKQLSTEISTASRKGDLVALSEIVEEVEASGWSCPVPRELIDAAHEQFTQVRATVSRQTLAEFLPLMDRAYSEFDVTRASLLAKQWREHSQHALLPATDPLIQQATPILEWVAGQEQAAVDARDFRQCLSQLEKALDGEAPRAKLEKLYRQAQRFDQPIPHVLELRVNDKIESLQVGSRRRFILTTAAVSILLAAAGTALILYWQQLRTDRTVSEHSAALAALLDSDRIEEADKYVNRLSPELQRSSAIAGLLTQLQQMQQNEARRAEALTSLFKRAEEMDTDKPDHALIKQIEETIKLPEEKDKLTVIKLRITRRQQELQDERDQAFAKTVEKWSDRLASLDARTVPTSQLTESWLRSMQSELQTELNQHGVVSATIRRQGDALTAKLRAIIDRERSLESQKSMLASAFENVGKVDEYLAALKRFADRFPNTQHSTDVAAVLDEEKAWRSVLAWSEFWHVHGQDWQNLTPQRAKFIAEAGDKLSQEHDYNDLSAAFLERKPYLDAIAARTDVDVNGLKSFLFQNRLMNKTWMVIDQNGDRYYCPEEPTDTLGSQSEKIVARIFNDADLTEIRRSFTRKDVDIMPSPQAKLVAGNGNRKNGLREIMQNLNDANWDSTFFRMAQSVRDAATARPSSSDKPSEPELDPILAMDMLRRILKTGSQGSYLFNDAFGLTADEIENSGVDLSVSWFLPDDKPANSARREAKAIVAGLPDFRSLTEDTRRTEGHRRAPPSEAYEWIAALVRLGDERFACSPQLTENVTGVLCTVATDIGQHVLIHEIGYVENGKVTWAPGVPSTVLATGRPVFLRSPTTVNSPSAN